MNEHVSIYIIIFIIIQLHYMSEDPSDATYNIILFGIQNLLI